MEPTTGLLVTDLDPELLAKLEESARKQGTSVSDEAKRLIRFELSKAEVQVSDNPMGADDSRKLGSLMFDTIRPEDRGDDLVFEDRDSDLKPPDV
jgi:hypothetical protein